MRGDFRSTEILNQLEEIRAQQRQIQAELFDSELREMNRVQSESLLRSYLEDCE